MQFQIRESYNFDLLNMLNILTGETIYTRLHPQAYAEFGEALSDESREILSMVREALGNAMISPLVNFVLSFVPDFEDEDLLALLADEERLLTGITQNDQRMALKANEMLPLIRSILPVLSEVENMGFREYWLEVCYPEITEEQKKLRSFINQTGISEKVAALTGPENMPDEITLYLCAFAAPHGIKINGPRYIADMRFLPETVLKLSLHEIFLSCLDQTLSQAVLNQIAADPFITLAYEKTESEIGFANMAGYLKKNIVEAMFLWVKQEVGLEDDPFEYLLNQDGGAYVFAVILLDWMNKYPKAENQRFADYFANLAHQMPLGHLMTAYQSVLKDAGKELDF